MTFNRYSLDLESSSSQYAYVADNAALSITGDISIEAWIKLETLPSANMVVMGKYDTNNQRSYQLYFDSSANLTFVFSGNGSTTFSSAKITSAFTSADVGKWVHVATTADVSLGASGINFYKNGVSVANTDVDNTATAIYDGTSAFAIGTRFATGTPGEFFDGLVNNARVWSDIRTAAEILAGMYAVYTGTSDNLVGSWYATANNHNDLAGSNNLTAVNTPVFSTNVPFTGANSTDWNTSYQIKADHTKVSGASDLTNFPVLIKDGNIPDSVYVGLKQGTWINEQKIGINHLTSDITTTDATSFNTASISPGANRLVLVSVTHLISSGDVNEPTVTGASMTWTKVVTNNPNPGVGPGNNRRVTVFRALSASPGSGALTIDFAGQTQARCAWSITEFIGVDISGTNGSGAIVQSATNFATGTITGLTVTLSAFSNTNNATYGSIHKNLAATISPGSGFSEISETTIDSQLEHQVQWKNSNDTSVDWSWSSEDVQALGVAIEIKSGGGSDLRITTDSAGTTEIPYEIVSMDTTAKTAEIWAKVPTLYTASDTSLYLWSGNANAIAYDANAPFGSQAVWTDYNGVWHLEGSANDSTTNARNGTSTSIDYSTANGKLGQGAGHNANSDNITLPSSISMSGTVALQAWIKTASTDSTNANTISPALPLMINGGSYATLGVHNGKVRYNVYTTSWTNNDSTGTVNDDAYRKIDVVDTGSAQSFYIDGAASGTASRSRGGNVIVNAFGYYSGGTPDWFDGEYDELRIRNSTLSADWIATEYANQNSPSTFWITSTAYTSTLTETVTLVDTIIKSESRTLTDTATAVDTVIKSISRSLLDYLTLVDSVLKGPERTLTDSSTPSDYVIKETNRTLTDVVTPSDSILRSIARTLTDSLTPSDSIEKLLNRLTSSIPTTLRHLANIKPFGFGKSVSEPRPSLKDNNKPSMM